MANRFWVGGTGTWDSTSTTHWSTSTGGSAGASVPGVGDVATFDASSGGGVVTVDSTVSGVTLGGIAAGAFTGTLDFSVNNPSMTLTGAPGLGLSGTGARTIKLGTGTFTLSGNLGAAIVDLGTTTNLNASSDLSHCSLVFAPTSTVVGQRSFSTGGQSWGAVTVVDSSTLTGLPFSISGAGYTLASLAISGQVNLLFNNNGTITNAPSLSGTLANPIGVFGAATTVTITTGNVTLDKAVVRGIAFSGGTNVATNSFDLKGNSGITITPPSSGGSAGVIGS